MSEVIKAKNIYLEYNGREILDISELTVYEGERIGLVGNNGSGKTSLLNILSGNMKPGGYQVAHNGNVVLIPQILPKQNTDINKFDYWTSIWQINYKSYDYMSGGEQTRYRISQAFAENAVCILADEPTSHLDKNGVELLIQQLEYFPGALIIISHDRYFLDSMVHKIWEIKNHDIKEYYGNYSDYIELKRCEREQHKKEYQIYIDEKQRLEQAAEFKKKQANNLDSKQIGKPPKNNTQQAGKNSTQRPTGSKVKSVNKTAKSIEQRLENLEEITPPTMETRVIFRQSKAIKLYNDYPIMGDNINKKLGEHHLFEDTSIIIPLAKKIAIIGDNGVGKTTLLRMILSGDEAFTIAQKAQIGYFEQQNYVSDSKETLLEFLLEDSDYKPNELIAMLVQMGFGKDDIRKSLFQLSGGELTKLMLLKILSGEYNILMMDEPSTFLDTYAVNALETMMKEYKGTILFVTHDKTLVNNVADIIYEIKDRKINRIKG
ncbi:ribosomal protection-like ABC-F family protein [Tissierella sp.]|uniref:ribosomal protection-like ABC-F family protein n=1 Tax=Tissierella sp. TaxID=41274 RepID=UPI0028639FF6|nr:ABC-F type ribosomal protection protein [Tissierella sp.]MDR7855497.1 ABC-F type ribosomal protection protein [Tissierella sp.]